MPKFVKKPLPVEAIQWTGNNLKEVLDFTGKADNWGEYFATFEEYEEHVAGDGFRFKVFTPCLTLIAEVNDWVVRTHEDEIVIVHKERFADEYQEAGELTFLLVPDNLLGAACYALNKYGNAPKTLEGLRKITMGRPTPIAAHVWHKNGDHPDDYKVAITDGPHDVYTPEEQRRNDWSGQVVKRFRHPDVPGGTPCPVCGQTMHVHGWIDQGKDGLVVCPADTVVTLDDGTYEVRK